MGAIVVDVITALVCFVAGLAARTLWTAFRKRREQRRELLQKLQRRPHYTRQWLVDYYGGAPSGQLYCYEENGRVYPTQLLMHPSWNLPPDTTDDDLLDQQLPQRRSSVQVRPRVVRRKGHHIDLADEKGQEWNEYIASAARVDSSSGRPRIVVQLAEYFQFLTACFPLEDETYRAVRAARWSPRRTARLRARLLPSVEAAEECRLGAQPIGIQAAIVFETKAGPRILIQRRSVNVSSYGGALAVVPVFGCQTNDLTEQSEVSLFHNFLREVYEELYGGVEVERGSPRLDCFWFYRTDPISRLLEAQAKGLVAWRLLGFGFDALNGELDVMALARFRQSRFTEHEFDDMRGNWEINRIQAMDLFDADLTNLVHQGEFSAGSAYAIMESRRLYSEGFNAS